MVATAPIWLILIAQFVSVCGDALGQRTSRIHHHGSRRHTTLSITVMNFLQMGIIMLLCEYLLPQSISGAVYEDGEKIQCYREIDLDHRTDVDCKNLRHSSHPCHECRCPRQGPVSALVSLYYYPLLLIGGLINITYYTGEVLLYMQPLALLFLVLSSLASSFLVNPLLVLFGSTPGEKVSGIVYVAGLFGALLCTVEFPSKQITREGKLFSLLRILLAQSRPKPRAMEVTSPAETASIDGDSVVTVEDDVGEVSPLLDTRVEENGGYQSLAARRHVMGADLSIQENLDDSSGSDEQPLVALPMAPPDDAAEAFVAKPSKRFGARRIVRIVMSTFLTSAAIVIPFGVLSFSYAVWFILQKIFDSKYHVNAFAFNSLDKVILVLYLIPYLVFVDIFPPYKRVFEKKELWNESLYSCYKNTFKEAIRGTAWINLFFFRLLINGRSFLYFYLAVLYDLNTTYLELTLIRILFSWLGVIVVCLFIPRFSGTSPEERRKAFAPLSILLKCAGSILILFCLLVLNGTI